VISGLVIVLLIALGIHTLFVDLDPAHIAITLAVVGVGYHLAVALIYRYIWPGKR
jgi:hypothetical protein